MSSFILKSSSRIALILAIGLVIMDHSVSQKSAGAKLVLEESEDHHRRLESERGCDNPEFPGNLLLDSRTEHSKNANVPNNKYTNDDSRTTQVRLPEGAPPDRKNVTIDTWDDIGKIENPADCQYRQDHPYFCNNNYTILPGQYGFWSACTGTQCELVILLSALKAGDENQLLPCSVNLLTFVDGFATIRLFYRINMWNEIINLEPNLVGDLGWTTTNFDLSQIDGLDFETSTIHIRFVSSDGFNGVIDKIVFEYLSNGFGCGPTTTETTQVTNSDLTTATMPWTQETAPDSAHTEETTRTHDQSSTPPDTSTITTAESEATTDSTNSDTIPPISTTPASERASTEDVTFSGSTTLTATSSSSSEDMSTSTEFRTTASSLTEMTDETTTTSDAKPWPPRPPESTTSSPECDSGLYCDATDHHGERWKACTGTTATQKCPADATGTATWFCRDDGEFEWKHPDYSNCSSRWISDVEHEMDDFLGQPLPVKTADELLKTIKLNCDQFLYFGHEIESVIGLNSRVLHQVETEIGVPKIEKLTERAWEVFGEILTPGKPWEELSMQGRTQTGTKLLAAIDETAFQLLLQVQAQSDLPKGYTRPFASGDKFQILSGIQPIGESELKFPENFSAENSSIQLPLDWAKYFEEQIIIFAGVHIRNEELNYIFGNQNLSPASADKDNHNFLNSDLIGFSFGEPNNDKSSRIGSVFEIRNSTKAYELNFTGDGVKIELRHSLETSGSRTRVLKRRRHEGELEKPVLGSAKCVYWDVQKLEWSAEGCQMVQSGPSSTLCECFHLSSFAVLMDKHNFVGKDAGLEILTLILCPLSSICLAITILIFATTRAIHGVRTTITNNLCICLLVGNLSFLLLVDRNYFYLSEGACTAAAIFVHYTFLCCFLWMGVQGWHLYKQMVFVFESGTVRMAVYRAIALGFPVLVVGVTVAISLFKSDDAYGSEMFCWLQGNYIWAFLVPVALVCLFNTVVLIITLRIAGQVNSSNAKAKKRVQKYIPYIRGGLSITVLLGLTWASGFFMMIDDSTTSTLAGYAFTVLNASQGTFLFVFHCLLNEKVRGALGRKFNVFQSKFKSHGTSATSTSQAQLYKP